MANRQHADSRGIPLRATTGAAAVAAAVALWTVGRFGTPSPATLSTLLAATLGLGATVTVASLWRWRRRPAEVEPRWACVLGLAATAAGGAFLFALFGNDDGPVPILRHADAKPPATDRLRILCFNVLHGYPDFVDQEARFRDTLAAIRKLAPDLLILQEAWTTHAHGSMAQRLASALRMDAAYARANGSLRRIGFEEGSAVLSRFPLREARRAILAPRWPLHETRIGIIASATVNDQPIRVVGTHLTFCDDDTTLRQALSLLDRLPDRLLVLAGDFNAPSAAPAVQAVCAAGFTDALPGQIDHVFVPQAGTTEWKLVPGSVRWTLRPDDLAELIGTRAEISDHPAIVADFARR